MELRAISDPARSTAGNAAPAADASLAESARRFEAAFIAAMLKQAGFEKALATDAGAGGNAFSSMLVDRYAEAMAQNKGFNMQKQIIQALSKSGQE